MARRASAAPRRVPATRRRVSAAGRVPPARPALAAKSADDLLELGTALDFMRLLWAVDHGLQSGSKRMAAALGVTGPQRLVVRIIGKRPGLSPGRLARILHVHPSTLTGVLRRLEERGAIERQGAIDDGRRDELSLTPRGRRIDRWQVGTVEATIRRTLANLDARAIAGARQVLGAIAIDLEAMSGATSRVFLPGPTAPARRGRPRQIARPSRVRGFNP